MITTKILGYVSAGLLAALLISNGVWWVRSAALDAQLTATAAAKETAEASVATLKKNANTDMLQHDITRGSLTLVQEALNACQTAKQVQQEQNDAARVAAAARQRDTDRTLAKITADFQAALRDPACLICGNQPVCPRLLGESP